MFKHSRLALLLTLAWVDRHAALLGSVNRDLNVAGQVVELLQPSISFSLEEELIETAHSDRSWKALAQKAAGLQQLECHPTLVDGVLNMVDAAEDGDVLAMAGLGTIYLFGQDCLRKRNLTWGFHWLSRAAHLKQPDAQATMGFLHASNILRDVYNFTTFTANRSHANVLFERAAEGGSLYALMALGYRHTSGIGVQESCAVGAELYERVRILKHFPATCCLLQLSSILSSCARVQAALKAVDALDLLRRHTVEQSHPSDAEHLVALAHHMVGHERVDQTAVEYMDYCAHIGDVTGKVSMGHLYHSGSHGVPRDQKAAFHWFHSAARQGDGMGHANLGLMLLRRKKYQSAIKSLRRATKLRDVSAWAGMGYAYLYGAGAPQSDVLAAKSIWFAARQGHLDSIFNLGVLSLVGRGVPQSVLTGFRYLSVAAEYGQPYAQLHVGQLARRGLGVREDCQTARFFLKHVADGAPLIRSLMSVALSAHEHGLPQRALIHYSLAAHAGIEVAQQNAGFLYANAPLPLRSENALVFQQRALQYFNLAALQGSKDAQVQLANLLTERREFAKANELYKEAAQQGSRDALWHLGMSYWRGHGVEKSWQTAWELWRSAGVQSKYAQLQGSEAALFGLARLIFEARVALLLGAVLLAVATNGGKPIVALRESLLGGVPGEGHSTYQYDAEDFDDFDDSI